MLRWRRIINSTFVLIVLSILIITPGCFSKSSITIRAQSEEPPIEPILRIEAGMHNAPIIRIGVDAAERYLVTASEDKTTRVWDLQSGELLRILRPPIGDGNEGKLYAVALSPDGGTVAMGGWTGVGQSSNNIYLFDRASGALLRRVTDLPDVVYHLTYSSDGRYLAAALGGENGIRVFVTDDYREIFSDKDYDDDSYWIEFSSDGHLVSTSYDGFLRLYDARFKLLAREKVPGGNNPFSASFSPDDRRIAVGFTDSTAVNVLSGNDLSLLYTSNTKGRDNSDLGSVAWSEDGQILHAGGTFGGSDSPILAWSEQGRGELRSLQASKSTLMHLWPLSQKRLVYGAADPAFGILHNNGTPVWRRTQINVDFRTSYYRIRTSHDGAVIDFDYDILNYDNNWSKHRTHLDSTIGEIFFDPPASEALSPPHIHATGLRIDSWSNSTNPTLNDQPLPLQPFETAWSVAIAPDGQHITLGTSWNLRLFNRQRELLWQMAIPSTAWMINISGDGRFIIAALGDGTIRWYRLQDGKEQLAFYLHSDKRWVLWTPEGFFNASTGGEQLIGYHLNQGADQATEFVNVEQLYELFYRPDLIARRLDDGIEQELQAELARIGDVRDILRGDLPPVLELLSPSESRQHQPEFTLKFDINAKNGGIGRIEYRINGVTVGDPQARPVNTHLSGYQRPFTLNVGRNEIEVIVYNEKGTVASQPIKAVVEVDGNENQASLHVLALGVSDYYDSSLKLAYAASDAEAVASALTRQAQRLFRKVHVKTLLDDEVKLANVEQAFQTMAEDIQEHDVFVLYLAGHGMVINGEYHFIPQDVVYTNQEQVRKASIDQDRFQSLLAGIPARKSLLLFDSCFAGQFVTASAGNALTPLLATRGIEEKTAMDKLMRATGRAVLAASSAQQFALEGYENHGLFTYTLLQGLLGQADRNGNKSISITELAEHVSEHVPRISMEKWQYRQVPMHQLQGQSFPIGLVR